MEIRNLQDLNINKVIIHILDNKGKKLILNDFELNLRESRVQQLFLEHIRKSIKNEGTRMAKFANEINVVKEHCKKFWKMERKILLFHLNK